MATSEKGNDSKKILLLGGGVVALVVVIGGYWIFAPESTDTAESKVSATTLSANGYSQKERNDPQYNKLLQTWNQNGSSSAGNSGGSFISTLQASNPTNVDTADKLPPPKYNWEQQQQTAANSNDNKAAEKQRAEEEKAIAAVLQKIDANSKPVQGATLASAWGGKSGADGQGAGSEFSDWTDSVYPQQAKLSQQDAAEKKQGKERGARLISAYTRVPAIIDNSMDSDDINSPLLAHVPTGEQKGAKFFSSENRLAGDGIRTHFTGMEWNGVECKISAYAINAETLRASISSDVNNRWFTHIVLPAIANGIGRTGQLYEDSNSQMILTEGGNAYRSTGTPSGKAIAGTIAGGIGEQAGRVLAEQATRTPFKQVTVDPNQLIGIQFVAPVYESDCGEGVLSNNNQNQTTQQAAAAPTLNNVQPDQPQYAPPPPAYQSQPYPDYSYGRRGYYR